MEEQRDKGRKEGMKEISEEGRREVKKSNNERRYKEMMSIRWKIGNR